MRARMERLASFPFPAGCVSQSSVEVLAAIRPRRPRPDRAPPPPPPATEDAGEREAGTVAGVLGSGIPKAVMRGIRSFSQLFSERSGEEERAMEIGYPTDVQHIAHIGLDGLSALGPAAADDRLGRAPELLFLPPVSLAHLELAMNRS